MVGTCVCRMVCVLVLDGCGVVQSWARLIVVGSWLLFVIHRLLVDWTCGGGKAWKGELLMASVEPALMDGRLVGELSRSGGRTWTRRWWRRGRRRWRWGRRG